MSADWASWVEQAKKRKAEGASPAAIMLDLARRGASAGEAEAVTRSIGASPELSAAERAEVLRQKCMARLAVIGGVLALGAGLGVLVSVGPGALLGDEGLVAGSLTLAGLALIGKNVGTM
ncbi:MAG: hypothetical protein MUC96_30260 [Myxococcaceae bacterium]|jgi:hypothetical protein|nr:hypothetical protein [Myxococcaceae bacterium]